MAGYKCGAESVVRWLIMVSEVSAMVNIMKNVC